MTRYLCFLALLISSLAVAQECTRSMIVDVFDERTGHGVDKLEAQDFIASLDHRALKVVSSTQDFNNRVIALVEASGIDIAENADVLKSVAEQVRQAPSGRPVAFGAFGEHAVFTKGFLTDQKARSSAVDGVLQASATAGNRVALFDAIHEANLLFGPHQDGDTILLISDGNDNSSKRNAEDLDKELTLSGTRLLTVIRRKTRMVTQDFRQRVRREVFDLKILTSSSGGSYTQGVTPRALEFAWAGYLLKVEPPSGLTKAKEWSLAVKDESGKPSQHHFLFYPAHLAPCGQGMARR